ncbi:MAG: DUF6048 family protein [Bacteroidota bacterium]
MKTFGFTISLLIVFASIGLGQTEIAIHPDSVKGKYIPTGIRIGAELINIGRSASNTDLSEYTFTADIDFNRFIFNVEFGTYDRSFDDRAGSLYSVSGTYFRIGPDINFLKRDPDKSVLFFGLRYGWTQLDDELTYINTGSVFTNEERSISNSSLTTNWGELVTGLKVKIWKVLWLGYTARFRFGADNFERNELIPHYIPGYGRADKTVSWAFNYWLMVRLPLRKAPVVLFDKQ